MITWTKFNNKQLNRLEELIEDTNPICVSILGKKEKSLKEVKEILANKTLDLDNEMGTLDKPLIISAAIWNSIEVIELLLEKNIDVNRAYNPFYIYGEIEPTDYCQNKQVNCLDILFKQKSEIEGFLIENEDLIAPLVYNFEIKHLENVKACISIIENYININSFRFEELNKNNKPVKLRKLQSLNDICFDDGK